MSFTKKEKRLFIRDKAVEIYCHQPMSYVFDGKKLDIMFAEKALNEAKYIADLIESFERKQDEEEEEKEPECFGYDLRLSQCFDCSFVGKCQEKRGAK